ncbi:MAG: hypothetical protein JKX69_13825 [Rhodobacteraceae bacterium]|nr:hypothetical protein [Paracoccaceae bacterium]
MINHVILPKFSVTGIVLGRAVLVCGLLAGGVLVGGGLVLGHVASYKITLLVYAQTGQRGKRGIAAD